MSTVMITGETGTGKEVVARTIHDLSPQHVEPFLAINLAAVPESMVESELFGHERGAFTGAVSRRDGILRAAGKGTVLLDEIGELPLAIQAKLLRTLEEKEVRPVGSDRNVAIEARILAATHRDLKAMVQQGAFREDLYYRLNVVPIAVPALRERPDDIPALCQVLMRRHAKRARSTIATLTAATMRSLCAYGWPGNVRELSNVLERALFFAENGQIDVKQLPEELRGDVSAQGLHEAVQRFERMHIGSVLRLCGGNREEAAAQLKISPATLYRRLEKLDLKKNAAEDDQDSPA